MRLYGDGIYTESTRVQPEQVAHKMSDPPLLVRLLTEPYFLNAEPFYAGACEDAFYGEHLYRDVFAVIDETRGKDCTR